MSKDKSFKPEDLQKELEDLIKDKFGSNIQVITQAFDQFNAQDTQAAAPSKETETAGVASSSQFLEFSKLPKEIKEYLDDYIISQDDAKKALAIAICDHYNQVKYYNTLDNEQKAAHSYAKQNVLLLGPTGVGKTYMVKQLAKLIGVPFVKADATKYSETGYMGANVEDLIKDLLQQANGDISKAEFGIVYIDEADKLATQGSKFHGKDVNGRGVQLGLLKMMEETDVDLRSGNDPSSHIQAFMEMQSTGGKLPDKIVNTRHILFILSGAFTGLEEIIGKRLSQKSIGFAAAEKEDDTPSEKLLKKVSTEDLTKFGLEPEFVGRLPVRVSCNHLTEDNLFHILKDSKESILAQYKRAFGSYGINIEFTDDALMEIAIRAKKENTGARSLFTIIESSLREFKYHLPSTLIRNLKVDKDLIISPNEALEKLLKEDTKLRSDISKSIADFEANFTAKTGVHIEFSQAAINEILNALLTFKGSTTDFLNKTLDGYDHGLKVIVQNIGDVKISIPSESITDPKKTLDGWVKSTIKNQGLHGATEELPNTEHTIH